MEKAHSPVKSRKKSEQTTNHWSEVELKLLISICGVEYGKREKGRRLEAMWERIAARLVKESQEFSKRP